MVPNIKKIVLHDKCFLCKKNMVQKIVTIKEMFMEATQQYFGNYNLVMSNISENI